MDHWTRAVDTVLCDLDGVVWLDHEPIAGSVEALAMLRSAGMRVLFVTNNSAHTIDDHEQALSRIGIAARGDVVSSAMAAAQLVLPGERVLVAAGPGVVEALERRGAEVMLNNGRPPVGSVDAVVVGLHRDFDYDRLSVAASAARTCGRLIGTNTDPTLPTPTGPLPGGGALLAAVAAASGVEPVIAGKPYPPMGELVSAIVTATRQPVRPERMVMVGDRIDTDGRFAAHLGCRFALVRSGVAADRRPPQQHLRGTPVAVDLEVDDLAAVARHLLNSNRNQQ